MSAASTRLHKRKAGLGQLLLNCGNSRIESGRLDDAICEYSRILRVNPNYPLADYHLAQAYERKGERQQAATAYERFLQNWKQADPDIPEIENARKKTSGRLARNAFVSGG